MHCLGAGLFEAIHSTRIFAGIILARAIPSGLPRLGFAPKLAEVSKVLSWLAFLYRVGIG